MREQKFAVIGDPIAHSKSPEIHQVVFAHYKQNASYARVQVKKGALAPWIQTVRTEGYAGFNVTMPHKTDIIAHLDEVAEEAALTGAVNTVVHRNGKLIGYNTDGAGFFRALVEDGIKAVDKHIVILGAGATAGVLAYRAVLAGAKSVTILARRGEQAKTLVTQLFKCTQAKNLHWDGMKPEQLAAHMAQAEILINATPQGMQGVTDQWKDLTFIQNLPSGAVVCDVINTPKETKFLKKAKECGHQTQNGTAMLVHQAIEADQLYLNRTINEAKLVSEMMKIVGEKA